MSAVAPGALYASAELRKAMAALRAEGAMPGVLLNALAAVSGELVREIVVEEEFTGRLAKDFLGRVQAHARRG